MKKSQLILLTAIVAVVILFAITVRADRDSQSTDKISRERQLDSFERIHLNGAADLRIKVGEEQKVVVNSRERDLDNIETRVSRHGTLIITEDNYHSRFQSIIEIQIPQLTELVINGSGDADLDYGWGEQLEISIHGSGNVYAEGSVRELEISVYGSGDVDAHNLKAESAEVTIHGSGDVDVFAREKFIGNIFGSGDIDIDGDPESRTYNIHGSGDIIGMVFPPVPAVPELPAMIELADIPEIPEIHEIPALKTIPELPALPIRPELPNIHSIPALPEIPALPAIPEIPEIPAKKVYDKDINYPE